MKRIVHSFLLSILILALSACSGMPQLFWNDDGQNPQASDSEASVGEGRAHAPVKVSKEAGEAYELPAAEGVATRADGPLPERYGKLLEDRAVTMDSHPFDAQRGKLFSAVVDAMYALNIPVDTVDSSNGVITSDWVRQGDNNPNFTPSLFHNTRHRFVIRVNEVGGKSNLEVHVIGQEYEGRQWVDQPLKRKVSKELFDAVGEQLRR